MLAAFLKNGLGFWQTPNNSLERKIDQTIG